MRPSTRRPRPGAVVYLQASSADHAETGSGYITRDRKTCLTAATELGAEVVAEYIDVEYSDSLTLRPKLRTLLNRLSGNHDIRFVVVPQLWIWAMNVPTYRALKQQLDRSGVRLIVAAEPDTWSTQADKTEDRAKNERLADKMLLRKAHELEREPFAREIFRWEPARIAWLQASPTI